MVEKYFFLYFNVTITTLKVNLLVYSDLCVVISPIFIVTYYHAFMVNAPKPNHSAHVRGLSYPCTWVLIPTYTGMDAQSHG